MLPDAEGVRLAEDAWRQLWLELRHLESRLHASPLGWALVPVERAWSRAEAANLRFRLVLRLAAEALGDDLARLSDWLRAAG